ncbi:MAG TPA: RraA family protein [Bryobacteraceae bacterium]|nr:RraA family protein [Bryobacteraceae bacterium]
MTAQSVLTKADFEKLRTIDTCTVSNAIERLHGRLRNEGQISGSVLHCIFPHLPPVLGYAVTGCMRASTEPVAGRTYHENMSWWHYVASIPEPRIMVVEDRDEKPGGGALVGELHAIIGQALHCVAYVTNGSVRDLPGVEAIGFQLFAGSVAVSHKYAHISEYGRPVEIDGLTIAPGDLLHGDRHGVHSIPLSIASEIPAMAAEINREEEELKKLCRSPGFSLQKLEEELQKIPGGGFETPLDGYRS